MASFTLEEGSIRSCSSRLMAMMPCIGVRSSVSRTKPQLVSGRQQLRYARNVTKRTVGHVGEEVGLGLRGPPQLGVDDVLLLERGAQALGGLHARVVMARRERREQDPQEYVAVRPAWL
jgi:hypothetical protein